MRVTDLQGWALAHLQLCPHLLTRNPGLRCWEHKPHGAAAWRDTAGLLWTARLSPQVTVQIAGPMRE